MDIYRCGVGVVIETLISVLHEAGWRTQWIYPGYKNRQGRVGETTLFSFKTPRQEIYRDAWFLWTPLGIVNLLKLIWLFWHWKPDLVVLHGAHQAPQIALVAAKILGIPVALKLHTFDDYYIESKFPGRLKKIAKDYQRIMNYLLARFSDRVWPPSKWYANFFRKYCGYQGGMEDDVSLVVTNPPLQEKEAYKSQFLDKLGLAKRSKLVMYFGRICQEKNVSFLLEVMRELKTIMPAEQMPTLVLAGGGEAEYLQSLLNLAQIWNFGQNIRILGEYELEEGLAWMQMADIVWLPSKSETQGLVAVEAMQVAIVFVLADYAMAEFVGIEECLLPEDAKVWAESSKAILADEARAQELRARLAKRAAQYTDRAAYQKKLLEKYRGLFRK